MKQSGHFNHSEETGTGCPVTSKYGRTPPNKHGGMGKQQHQYVSQRPPHVLLQSTNVCLKCPLFVSFLIWLFLVKITRYTCRRA